LPDLGSYGFSYTANLRDGLLSWSPDVQHENITTTIEANSLEECAQQCQGLNATFGGWIEEFNSCDCNFLVRENVCREPCIALPVVTVGFGTFPIEDIEHCEKSFCDEEWFYNDFISFCDTYYNHSECQAKIEGSISPPLTSQSLQSDDTC